MKSGKRDHGEVEGTASDNAREPKHPRADRLDGPSPHGEASTHGPALNPQNSVVGVPAGPSPGPSGGAAPGNDELDLDIVMPRGESPAWLYVGGGQPSDVKVFDRARCSSTRSIESPQHLMDPNAERFPPATIAGARLTSAHVHTGL